jgi:hypothetical protein
MSKRTLEVVMRRFSLITTLAVALWGACTAQAHAYVFWTDGGTDSIGRANLDGTAADNGFMNGASAVRAIAVDDRHLYWTEPQTGAIGRANVDGSDADVNFIAGAGTAVAIAVGDRYIYWADLPRAAIGRANLDGSGVDRSFITGIRGTTGLAVDDRYLYWASGGDGTIGRAKLDGSAVNGSFVTGANVPVAVAVDDQHVYWTSRGADAIGRANLDGTGADESFIIGAGAPWAVAVDARHVYWTSDATSAIGRAKLDGSGADPVFVATASAAKGLAVDGGPAGTASGSASELSFGSQPLGAFGPPRALTISNSGHGSLEIDAARISGAGEDDFLVSHDSCSHRTLAVGDSCAVRMRFGPSVVGARQATLALMSNDPASPRLVTLQGIGAQSAHGPAGPAVPAEPAPAGPPTRFRRLRLVICGTLKAHGRRCRSRLATGPATFTAPRRARACLTRHGRMYATGTARRGRLVLHSHRRLRAGHYTLTLRSRGATTRTPITLR